MAKEQFTYPATRPLFTKLEQLSQQVGLSRGEVFQDWLTAMVCVLAAETKEDEYMTMIQRYTKGTVGKRGADVMAQMFGELVNVMTRENVDILGDLFQSSISYHEAGQYLSPQPIADLLAKMSIEPDARPTHDKPVYVNDPACGTGRMLLATAEVNPHVELVGQDVDARCAKITAISIGLRGHYGWVVCGNSLTGETRFAYRIGSFFHESPNGLRRGVIRDVPPETTPVPVIASRIRSDAKNLFENSERDERSKATPTPLPTIIEVPRWLARIEPMLADSDRGETEFTERRPADKQLDDELPPTLQRELF
ncbi:MAG: N-6 DNA methylase [Planctomycetaceae bacterium]|nr:N-6 DNA methylase [Planctomycetaceae bacterium]